MPTLGECCTILRISRRTLDKWLTRLQIEPTRHAYDYRYFELSAEQLEQIAEARRQMPSHFASISQPRHAPHRLPATDRIGTPESSQRPLSAIYKETLVYSDELPSSYRGRAKWVELHGGPKASYVRDWPDVGSWAGVEDAVQSVRRRRGWENWHPS